MPFNREREALEKPMTVADHEGFGALSVGAALNHNSGSAQAPCPVGGGEIHYGTGEDLERIDVALIA
jgi:hypothetical protein